MQCFYLFVLRCLELEYEASLPEKKSETLSRDLIDYVQYMIRNHGENYKVGGPCLCQVRVRGHVWELLPQCLWPLGERQRNPVTASS